MVAWRAALKKSHENRPRSIAGADMGHIAVCCLLVIDSIPFIFFV